MKEAPTRRVLVAGLGNPDRGDDGVGPLVMEKLAGLLPADVPIVRIGGDVLNLITEWVGFETAICVDAAAPLTAPGRIHRFDLATSRLSRDIAITSSHALSLTEAIELSRVLHLAPRDIIVFAIEGTSFAEGATMAPEVAAAAVEVAGRVAAEVAQCRALPPLGSDEPIEGCGPAHVVTSAGS